MFFNKMLLTIIRVVSFLLTLGLRQTNLPNYDLICMCVFSNKAMPYKQDQMKIW